MVSPTFISLQVLFIVAALIQLVSATSAKSAQHIVELHNQYRAKHQAPPVKWDPKLARFAQKWSNRCIFEHSTSPYGENLAMGHKNWASAIAGWYNEEKDYDYSNPGFTSSTGHFTAVVWKSTTRIGCGVKNCNGAKLYTCSYSPAGNVVTTDNLRFKQNVLPPV
ncbi:CAP domain-containing protein [Radiomyces spectabilis]|uniref:CAP domain-containing protein n=1 Tax=Radiomyces spectabilis TaxID=64574 RepID=UPI00221E9E68|nr:CAP domain-containing protein [Radiomyces spectabilis]KAI8378039.1 CAP domain-containing protein [Radiomyces spectabilis]